MKSKIKAIIFTAILVVSIGTATMPLASAADPNTLTIEDVTVAKDDSVTVPIEILNATGVSAVDMYLRFNRSVLNVTSATMGEFTSGFIPNFDNIESGELFISTYRSVSPPEDLTGDVIVGYVTLKAEGEELATSPLNVTYSALTDKYGDDVYPRHTDNGSFMVADETEPVVTSPDADPYVIASDGSTESNLSVYVEDPGRVDTVTVDLTNISGSSKYNLSLVSGNLYAGTWSNMTTASVSPGIYLLPVNATDVSGNSNISVSIEIRVVDPANITVGDVYGNVTVPIMLEGSSGTAGVDLYLYFNSSIVNVTSATMGNFTTTFIPNFANIGSGELYISTSIGGGQELTGDVIIANITFESVGESGETCELGLVIDAITNKFGDPVPARVINGTYATEVLLGDITGNGVINIGDVVRLANYVGTGFDPAFEPIGGHLAGDMNDNGVVNIGDVVRLANYVGTGFDPAFEPY